MARDERVKFLVTFGSTGINPIAQGQVTIGQALDAYVQWGRSEGKYVDQHYSQYNAHLRDRIHATPIVNLNPNLLSTLKAELLNTPTGNTKSRKAARIAAQKDKAKQPKLLAPQTVNNIFSFMRSAVNHAIATKLWSGSNPLSTRGSVWKMAKVNNKRLRFFTRDEAKALLADLEFRHHQLHDMGLLSLKTGLRATEIFKLRGQDVDDNACGLHIIQKGGKRVFVRVPTDMITMLKSYGRKSGEPIFQAPQKKQPSPRLLPVSGRQSRSSLLPLMMGTPCMRSHFIHSDIRLLRGWRNLARFL